MTLRAEHFHEIDRELIVLAGQRLMAWARDFAFHECDGETWYRTVDDDPIETLALLVDRIEEAERALEQTRRLLDRGASAGEGSGDARGAVPVTALDELPSTLREVIDRAGDADRFARWQEQVAATGYCSHPVRLSGRVEAADKETGEIREVYSTDSEPDATLLKACGNRRESRCMSCSATYRSDAWQLIAAGLRGGKGVPEAVAHHPMAFLTLTAPSFGPVHSRRERGGRSHPCRPKTGTCDHGRDRGCWRRHDDDDDLLGQPLCSECFDYDGAVLWNATATELWRRTTVYAYRALAKVVGVSAKALRGRLRLSYAKVAEYQQRGLVHFHIVVRLDGMDDAALPPSSFTTAVLIQALQAATASVTAPTQSPARVSRWGEQIDIRPIAAGDDNGLSAEAVAAYIAKYSTKSSDALGQLDHRIEDGDVDRLEVSGHLRQLVETAWRLGGDPALEHLRLRRWAHMLGFRGHFLTKSRRYSTTFGELRRARMRWRVRKRLGDAEPTDPWGRAESEQATVVLRRWGFAGIGYRTAGDAWLAESAAANAREQHQAARLELSVAA